MTWPGDPEPWSNALGAIESAATVIALIVGGIWTYLLFVRKRQRYPRAATSHKIVTRRLTTDKMLVTVCVTVKNSGDVLLELASGEVRVYRLLPLDADLEKRIRDQPDPVEEGRRELPWPRIGERPFNWGKNEAHEIEPGESDSFEFDFVLPGHQQTVQAYSYFRNVKKGHRDIGWGNTTYHDVSPDAAT